MQLPVGMLIYKAQRFSDKEAMVMGIWYYQEMFVPTTVIDKKKSWDDVKKKRCRVLTLTGTFDQICELIMQSDKYCHGSGREIDSYKQTIQNLLDSDSEPVMFDEVFAIKGTSLSIDTTVNVEDNIETIRAKVNAMKLITIKISPEWSFFNELFQ